MQIANCPIPRETISVLVRHAVALRSKRHGFPNNAPLTGDPGQETIGLFPSRISSGSYGNSRGPCALATNSDFLNVHLDFRNENGLTVRDQSANAMQLRSPFPMCNALNRIQRLNTYKIESYEEIGNKICPNCGIDRDSGVKSNSYRLNGQLDRSNQLFSLISMLITTKLNAFHLLTPVVFHRLIRPTISHLSNDISIIQAVESWQILLYHSDDGCRNLVRELRTLMKLQIDRKISKWF